jgi:hypothetical protein
MTHPSRYTLKCGGLSNWDPSLDHHGAALVATWVMSINVGLGLTHGLTCSRTT